MSVGGDVTACRRAGGYENSIEMKAMAFVVTSAVRSRVGNSGSGGAAVGPGWLLSARFDRHFIATTAAIAMRPGLFIPILMLDLWLLA